MDGDLVMTDLLVTFSAIARFLGKAQEAQEQLENANEEMRRAAQELCGKWEGAAAAAFADEQDVLYNWCSQLGMVGAEYMGVLQSVKAKYAEGENEIANKIRG